MTVMHVLTDSNVGGAGILVESLLRHTGIPKRSISVVLPEGAAMAERYAALGASVYPLLRVPDRSLSPRDLLPLARFLARRQPDILHTHAALTARIASRLPLGHQPVRVVTRHCAYPVGQQGVRVRRLCHRIGDRLLADCTVATAEAAVFNLVALGIPPARIRLIRNGAEALTRTSLEERRALRAHLGIPQEAFVVGMAARLEPVKGHITLLQAARLLLSRHTGYHFLLVGAGSEEAHLRSTAAAYGILPALTMVGYTADVVPYVNLFDLTANCSVGTETSCLALSEAMSLSIPCVVSRYGGNPELIHEGENGLLFPPGDAPALARAIERLRLDRALYRALSEGARTKYLAALRAPQMAAAYDALYDELLARREAGRRPV